MGYEKPRVECRERVHGRPPPVAQDADQLAIDDAFAALVRRLDVRWGILPDR